MDYSRGRQGGFGNRGGGGGFGGRRSFAPREMHKATCANCGQECTVPFKPDGKRPVYCRDCYGKMKESGQSFSKKEEKTENVESSESEESEESDESEDESDDM